MSLTVLKMKGPLRALSDNISWIFILLIQTMGLVYGGPVSSDYSSTSLEGKHLVITGLEVRIY